MEDKIKDFLENHTDIYKDIPKEVLQLGKEKIKNDEFFQLIIALETADDYFESYQFYAKLSENPDYEKNTLRSIERHKNTKNALERYINYLKILIKTNGFETCDC